MKFFISTNHWLFGKKIFGKAYVRAMGEPFKIIYKVGCFYFIKEEK